MKSISTTSQLIELLKQTDKYLPVFAILKRGSKRKFSMVDDNMDEVTELNLCDPMMASINDKYVLRTVTELLAELEEVEDKEKPLTVWEFDGDRYQVIAVVQINNEVHLEIEEFEYTTPFSL